MPAIAALMDVPLVGLARSHIGLSFVRFLFMNLLSVGANLFANAGSGSKAAPLREQVRSYCIAFLLLVPSPEHLHDSAAE